MIHSAIGVTRQGTPIPSLLTEDDLDYHTGKTRILLVGGLDGSDASVRTTLAALKWFYTDAQAEPYRERFALSADPGGKSGRLGDRCRLVQRLGW